MILIVMMMMMMMMMIMMTHVMRGKTDILLPQMLRGYVVSSVGRRASQIKNQACR
jgi:hypothetical protein